MAIVGLALFLSFTFAGAAVAPNSEPRHGELSLVAGFDEDPRVVALRAGGEVDATIIDSSCRGFITSAPDIRLNYEAGELPLIISVASASDTTLVVNAPDGTFHCDDDGGVKSRNPSIRFTAPTSGRYGIWVGTYRAGLGQPARVHVSEISSQ